MDLNQTDATWLFRHFNRRINDIHFRARGDHAVERFDIVIAQANAAGADAHPDPEIRIRSVQKINPTICRQANCMMSHRIIRASRYHGGQVDTLSFITGANVCRRGPGRISALIRDGGDHGRCERIAPQLTNTDRVDGHFVLARRVVIQT